MTAILDFIKSLWATIKPYVTNPIAVAIISGLAGALPTYYVQSLRHEVASKDAAGLAEVKGRYQVEMTMNEVASRAAARTVDEWISTHPAPVACASAEPRKVMQRRVRTKKVSETGSIE